MIYQIFLSSLIILIFLSSNLLSQFTKDVQMNPDQLKNAEEFVPQWAKKAVWYQIFPERFRNGDPSNDPKFENIRGCWPHDTTSPWQISPWTSDWYKLQSWEKQIGKNIWYNIQRRRYGGDIKGIIDKLDYLQELGVNAIYLNPVFEAPSLHKYDGATYHHIDPNFGPDPNGDRKIIDSEIPDDPSTWKWTTADKLVLKLIEEIHKRGMRIIFDGVFNHMGINSFAFKDVLKNQQKSRFKDWFTIKSWNNPDKGEKFDYEGWFGVKDLPELREDENGIVKGPREYIFAATKRWMDPDGNGNTLAGIDGWRLDVAFCVKHAFWKDWRKVVKSINPDAYLTAEVIDSIKAIKPYLEGDEFDAVMNYNFAFISFEYFIDEKNKLKTSEFDKKLKELRESFITGVSFVQQNLFDSHDTNRLLSHIVNRDLASYSNWPDFFQKSKAENSKYKTRKPNEDEIKIQKLMAIFQMTYLGAPMIYYGDEAGMWGANDPCCRKPMVWEDNKFEDEIFLPDQTKKMKPDKVEFNKDIFNHYKKLIEIRNSLPALQLGNFQTVLTDNKNEVYIFSRNYESQKIIVVINNSRLKKSVAVPIIIKEAFRDVLNGEQFNSDSAEIKIKLNPKWAAILVRIN